MPEVQVLLRSGINYSYAFSLDLENSFDQPWTSKWMQNNWHSSLYIICVYLTLIFGGQAWMSGRQKLELRPPLILWNVFMALFSTIGAFRTLPELFFVLKTFGFKYSICNASFILLDKVSGFWCFLFTMSKVLELFDTLFIVLRKQKLIFLHWYHHATVLILTWYFYASVTALGRWFMCMNYFVHSFMYTYYALRASKIRLPRGVAMCITAIQLAQTVFGSYIIIYGALDWLSKKEECQVQGDVVALALLLYSSNFVLFAQLFYYSYFSPKNKKIE